jgi:hypothetical protein
MALPKLDHDLGGACESVPDSNGAESNSFYHLTFLILLVLTVMRWATAHSPFEGVCQLPPHPLSQIPRAMPRYRTAR